ncbi:unnamed protein product, partial [marine sediment metagenome]
GNIANAKIYRIGYAEWKADPTNWFYRFFYGQKTDRAKLRGLIYNYRTYNEEFSDINDYDLIALSINFDIYPDDFNVFVTNAINKLYFTFPVFKNKEVIILAGNEVFEKRKSAEKVVQTTWDTAQGIRNSIKPDLPICCWNEKIYTNDEIKAFDKLLNDNIIKQVCRYIGYQSLNSYYHIVAIKKIQELGYEPINVELGTNNSGFDETKIMFNNDRETKVQKVFIMCPYISKELANYNENFKNYALSINGIYKDKFRLIEYIQQFKTKEEIIIGDDDMKLYLLKKGVKGNFVRWLQEILEVEYGYENDEDKHGEFGDLTENQVKAFQHANNLKVDGLVGKDTTIALYENSEDSKSWFKKLHIYRAFEK